MGRSSSGLRQVPELVLDADATDVVSVRVKPAHRLMKRRRVTLDEAGIIRKFGVPPKSIPDYLALGRRRGRRLPRLTRLGSKIVSGRS